MDDPEIAGVSLRQYAAVYAAIAEGFPLDVVLEADDVATGEWAAIDEAWNDAIVADLLAGGTLSDEFDAALLKQQEEYSRPLPPVDEDLTAWLGLLRGWSAAQDPDAFLRDRGLGPTDLARLHRRWSQMLGTDTATLREDATVALAGGSDPPRLNPPPLELRRPGIGRRNASTSSGVGSEPPRVTPSIRTALPADDGSPPKALRPRERAREQDETATAVDGSVPASAQGGTPEAVTATPTPADVADAFAAFTLRPDFELPDAKTVPPKDPSLSDELTLVQHAAVCAELEVRPHDAEATLAKYGLSDPSRRERLDREWRERLETETNVYAEWKRLYEHFREHFASMDSGAN